MVTFLAEAHMPSQLYGHCRGEDRTDALTKMSHVLVIS